MEELNSKGCINFTLAVMENYFTATPKKDNNHENDKRYLIMKNFYENADKFIEHTCEALEWDKEKFRKLMKNKLTEFRENM